MTFSLDQLATWLEETGHSGCAGDLITTVRDNPADAPGIARACANHVASDTPASLYGEAEYLPAELRAWADAQERRLAPAPLAGTFTAGKVQVTIPGRGPNRILAASASQPLPAAVTAWIEQVRALRITGCSLDAARKLAGPMPGQEKQGG